MNTKKAFYISLILIATTFIIPEANARGLGAQNQAVLNKLLSNVSYLSSSQIWGTGTAHQGKFVIWEGYFLEEYGDHVQMKLGTELVSSTFFVKWLPPGFNPYGSRVSVQHSKFLGRVVGEYEYFNKQGIQYHSAMIEPIVISDADFVGWDSGSFYHANYFQYEKESFRDKLITNCLLPGVLGTVLYYVYKLITAPPERKSRR